MSNEQADIEFRKRADAIIHLANEQRLTTPNEKVSSSLLYAAARFNAYLVASMSEDVEEMKTDKEEALKYFSAQYERMFVENIDDYIENYEEYILKLRHP